MVEAETNEEIKMLLDSGDEGAKLATDEAQIAAAVQEVKKEVEVARVAKSIEEMFRAAPIDLRYTEIDYSTVRGRMKDTSPVPCWDELDYVTKNMMAMVRAQVTTGFENYIADQTVPKSQYDATAAALSSHQMIVASVMSEGGVTEDDKQVNLSEVFDKIAMNRMNKDPAKFIPALAAYIKSRNPAEVVPAAG